MSLIVYHHPYSRAATVLWMLEELAIPHELKFVDIMKGAQKEPDILGLNPMGKIPLIVDDGVVVSESAAIALYLADKYSLGKLAPALDDPARGPYLRWSFYAPSVIEPGAMAKTNGWTAKPTQAGWGTYEAMMTTMDGAIAGKQFLLGDRFSMADVVFGGTIRFMTRFKMVEGTPALNDYAKRLGERPAAKRADARNEAIAKEHGLGG